MPRPSASRRSPPLAARARPLAAGCTALAVLCITLTLAAFATGQSPPGPRRLPSPQVPIEALQPVMQGPSTSPPARSSAPSAAPYLGPPAIIDGPSSPGTLETAPEEIVPGIGANGMLTMDDPFAEGLGEQDLLAMQPQKLSPYKSGFFQKLSFSATWFGNSNDPNDLGGTELETFLTVALPAPIVEWPLLITPGVNITFIDGPTVTDLPARLYLTYVDFMWLPKIFNQWTALLSVAPTVYGDFDAHQMRLTGKALAIYDAVPERLQFVAGVLYLNRENIRVLPAGGAIWMPFDWTRFELIFPKPKLATRLRYDLGYEDWLFTTAEFGGNTWPILRKSGVHDDVTYTDYRILTGFERKLNGGAGYRLEAGYVFGRSIRFTSGNGDFDPQNTILFRGAIVY